LWELYRGEDGTQKKKGVYPPKRLTRKPFWMGDSVVWILCS